MIGSVFSKHHCKGRHLANQRLPITVRQAINAFEEAIKLDP